MAEKEKQTKEKKTEGAKKEGTKAKKADAEKKTDKTDETKTSRTYVIPLRDAFRGKRTRRAKRASKIVLNFIKRHTKAEKPAIDPAVSTFIHSRGKTSIPRSVRVAVSKEGDKTTVKLAG
jgi:large subunit ribosomal protein L31e